MGITLLQTHVAKLKKESMQHNTTFPNARDSLRRSAKLTCVKYGNEPSRPREVSPNMEGLYNPWKVRSKGKGPQMSEKVGNKTKGTAKCGKERKRTL